MALSGGGGRRIWDDDIGVSVIEAEGFLLGHWRQRQQGQRDRMRTMQGTYVDSNSKKIGVSQQQWPRCGCQDGASRQERGDDCMAPDRRPAKARQGQYNNGVAKEVTGKREKGVGEGAHQQSTQAGQKGCDSGTTLK